jgi:tetratricopeptide (TPR) repeat protein
LYASLRWVLLIPACVALAGCSPTGQSSLDEQKDPHFLTAKSRKQAMDYSGAAEAFEKALEANPRSASAHFELGLLFYQNLSDPAAAIYHFEKYLKLQPRSNKADIVKQFVADSKKELARGAPLGPVNEQVKRELEKLVLEKEKLARDNAALQEQVEQLKAQFAQRTPLATGGSPISGSRTLAPAQTPTNSSNQPIAAVERVTTAREAANPAPARTHVIRTGDTPYAIARAYGVKLASLLSANPDMDPKRLRPGQTLAIPLQ